MSLPNDFDVPGDYFDASVRFFQEYQYLYNFPNTDILVHDILDKIDIENYQEIDVFNENIDQWAHSGFLNDFFEKLKRLQVVYESLLEESTGFDINIPLSPKKKHEIIYLCTEIKAVCGDSGTNVVVDLGSGLGYLDQLLFERTGYKVLGIECNESHYVGAKKRQRKYHQNSIDSVKYIKHRVTEKSHENIQQYLKDKFPNHRQFCAAGLHACADLSIDAINLFLKMDDATNLVLMPCCYHKMAETSGCFQNFPLSDCLKDIFKKYKGCEYIRVPFLRLATQPPSVEDKWDDLVFNLLTRAVLQLYAVRNDCNLKRNKRKAVKTKTMDNNFQSYLHDATTNGFTLIKNETSEQSNTVETCEYNLEEITAIWNELTPLIFKKAGMFIRLQNCLQPVIENFVLFDRIIYMKENGVSNCRFKKILNEKTSPRCLALIAYK